MKIFDLNTPYSPSVLVVAHGELFADAKTLNLIKRAKHLVVCDGALARYLEISTRIPDMVIGDGDSVDRAELEKLAVPFTIMADQETNDLTKAVDYAIAQGWQEVAIVGATGRREDHTLGNIFLLPDYYKKGAEVRIYSPFGVMTPFQGTLQLHTDVGRALSLFAIDAKPMSAKGVAYPFEKRVFTALWQATLNKATQPIVELWSKGVALLFVATDNRV